MVERSWWDSVRYSVLWIALVLLASSARLQASGVVDNADIGMQDDPHYNEVGFFDVHVCNWPNRPLFLLGLFSSSRYQELAKVELFTPAGQSLGLLDFNKFRLLEFKDKPKKKAFIKHFAIPAGAGDGWYRARIELKNGEVFEASDYVLIKSMARASGLVPPPGAEDVEIPKRLQWQTIAGAKYYQVFIRDLWQGKSVYKSRLLSTPYLELPPDLLHAGGYYSWQVHARDVNEHILLGDFNHGSLIEPVTFSVAE